MSFQWARGVTPTLVNMEGGVSSPAESPDVNVTGVSAASYVKQVCAHLIEYSGPFLIRLPHLPINCGHIREVAFGAREGDTYIDSSSGKY